MRMIGSITQQDNYGCGVACVAQASGKTYQAALDLLGPRPVQTRGYVCKDLIAALNIFGYYYTYKYLKPRLRRRIYADGVIVFIKRSKSYPAGHYLIRSGDLWMDPWINFKKNPNIKKAISGYRIRLPGQPIYGLFPSQKF